MECNDFNKIKQSILQLAPVDVPHIYLLNDFSDFTVISNKHEDEQTVIQSVRRDANDEACEASLCYILSLCDTLASEFYVPTFLNTLSVPSSWVG